MNAVIVTVPFAGIRHINLGMARLSPEKHATVRRMRHASATRFFLQMRRQFRPEKQLMLSTDGLVRAVRDAMPLRPAGRKNLECRFSGWCAQAVASMGPQERVDFALDKVEPLLPGTRANFELGTSFSWDNERYTEGACVPPELGHHALMEHARRPEGRIHFAGEHTSYKPNGGSMNYALESAVRVLLELSGS